LINRVIYVYPQVDAAFSPDDQGLDGVLLLFANFFSPGASHTAVVYKFISLPL